jgi:hypothetical protein
MRHLQTLAAAAALLTAGFVEADTPADACASLGEARAQLVAMTAEADVSKLDGYKAKIHAASKALDGNLAAMDGGPDAAKVQAFKPVWEDFKKTRETEIIPALYAGDKDKAKGLATGIQAERMKQMKAAMGCQ